MIPALVLVLLALIDVPLFLLLAGLTAALFWGNPHPGNAEFLSNWSDFANNFNMLERAVGLAQQPTLVAIPFFTVAGAIMSRGAIASRLIALADALFGWLPAGLAISTVAACALFAAISGSSPVTVITIGSVMYPALVRRNYPERFSLGLVTSAGSLGIIIPPSIPMIVFAIFASQAGSAVKVEELFIAGILPGFVIATCLVGFSLFKGWRFERDHFSLVRVGLALRQASWSLVVPVVILGGIYLGVFDTTAAAAIAVVLALAIEALVHRSLKVDDLPGILAESGALMGAVLVIIAFAFGLSEYLTIHKVPEAAVAALGRFDLDALTFILLLNVVLLITGCLMDIISAIILFVPLFLPIAAALGLDPIHVGIIFIVNLEIGYLTPPIGLNLFVAAGLFNKTIGETIRATVPYVLVMAVALATIAFLPWISLSLVNATRPAHLASATAFPSGRTLKASKSADANETGMLVQEKAVDVMDLAAPATPVEGGQLKSVAQVMAEARDSAVVGDRVAGEDFFPSGTLAWQEPGADGQPRTVVALADLPLCGPAGPDGRSEITDDTLVLRIVLPAGATAGDLEVPAQAQVEFGTAPGGAFQAKVRATGGKVRVVDAEGSDKGLFGVFAVQLPDTSGKVAELQGKFVPVACGEGEAPALGAKKP